MLGIDTNPFTLISGAFGLLCAFLFFVLRTGFPATITGLSEWGFSCTLMVLAAVGFAARGTLPVFFHIYLPNLLILAGVIAMHRSLRVFDKLPPREGPLIGLLALAAVALGWMTFIEDDYRLRVIVVSGLLAVLFAACGTVIARYRVKSFAERFTCAIYMITALVMAVRCVSVVLHRGMLALENDASTIHHVYVAAFPFSLVAMSLGFLLMANRALQRSLEAQALHDPMSGAYRRHAFMELLEREIAAARRAGRPVSVMMLDLDDFKAINDQHGHLVGDRVIADFAAKAMHLLRLQDVMGRYGGEEFIVLLPHTGIKVGTTIAERIRNRTAEPGPEGLPAYTVSIGIASLGTKHSDMAALLDAADKALYRAKRSGKNCVVAAAPDAARANAWDVPV